MSFMDKIFVCDLWTAILNIMNINSFRSESTGFLLQIEKFANTKIKVF